MQVFAVLDDSEDDFVHIACVMMCQSDVVLSWWVVVVGGRGTIEEWGFLCTSLVDV